MGINIDIKEQKGNPGFNPITSNRSPIKYQSTQNPGFLKTKQKKKRKKLIKPVSKNIKKKKKDKDQVFDEETQKGKDFEEKNYQRERTQMGKWENLRSKRTHIKK